MSDWREDLREGLTVSESPEWHSVVLKLSGQNTGNIRSTIDRNSPFERLRAPSGSGLMKTTYVLIHSPDGFQMSPETSRPQGSQPILKARFVGEKSSNLNICFEQRDPNAFKQILWLCLVVEPIFILALSFALHLQYPTLLTMWLIVLPMQLLFLYFSMKPSNYKGQMALLLNHLCKAAEVELNEIQFSSNLVQK